jgi:uncharacterized protein (DUF2384 family)
MDLADDATNKVLTLLAAGGAAVVALLALVVSIVALVRTWHWSPAPVHDPFKASLTSSTTRCRCSVSQYSSSSSSRFWIHSFFFGRTYRLV